jgi:ribosomal protein S20
MYRDVKINIIDTPGHSDFGGEVERVLNMADGCILLVDAFEGPMPQTRFVLHKALEIGLKPLVVVNKVDKPNCRPEEVYEMVFDLMCELDATEEQLDFPVIYGSAKNNWMGEDWSTPTGDITYLLDQILEHVPAPEQLEGTPQMLVTSLDYSNYTGRTEMTDEWGNLTGEYKITYSEPKRARGNISASRGASDADQFGISVNYNKTIVPEEDLGLTETSILWLDVVPENADTPYDYKVVEIAKSINEISYAIKRVDVIEKKTLRNNMIKSEYKTAVKKFEAAIAEGNKENAENLLKEAVKKIDGACSKGVIKKNTASRKKSNLAKKLNTLA